MAKTVSEILFAAADLIEPEGAWCQHSMGATADGMPCAEYGPRAVSFCIAGALSRAGNAGRWAWPYKELEAVESALGGENAVSWNNSPSRTQAEVVAKLREAAELAKQGEA